jgi:hypothetical protein
MAMSSSDLQTIQIARLMSSMGRLSYPPCAINPMTEKPFTRHKWVIPQGAEVRMKEKNGTAIAFYRVRCQRCGLNDPMAPTH